MSSDRKHRLPHAAACPGIRAVLLVCLIGLLTRFASAAPTQFVWNDSQSGDWSDSAKWTDNENSGSVPAASGLAAYSIEFNVAGAYTATQNLNPGFQLNHLRFGGSEVTITGNSLQFVTNGATLPGIEQSAAADVTINTPLSLASELALSGTGTGTVTISGTITGNGGITMNGSGSLALTGANTYRGATTVNSGTLQISQPNTGNDKSVISIAAGATLDLDFTSADTVAALVIDGMAKPDGTYDSTNSDGAITGSGSLLVVTPPPSSNATLTSLSVQTAALSPAFNPLTANYSASVPNNINVVTLTPFAAGAGATITVNGTTVPSGTASNPVALAVGPNLITTLVRAEDGVTTRSYTVNVSRASAAVVATSPAVVIDASRATLNGTVNPNGVSTVYFEYGTTPDFGSRTPDRDVSGTTSRAFAASVTGLKGATTYYYRAVLFNPAGTITGSTLQFTTVPNPPVAATGAPSNVTASSATFVGAVNPNGVQASVYFEYGLTTAYGQSTPVQKIPAGFNTVSFQAPDIPLIPNASYHYRLVASNSAGTSPGNDVLFSVQVGGGGGSGAPTAPPDVATGTAVAIGTEAAILQGTVNPNSGTTLVQFEYGITPDFGTNTSLQGVGNGDSPASVAIPVSGLLPGTTYHYRITGSNSLGKSFGDEGTFTTDFPPPTAVTGSSTVLTTTSVGVNGSVRARGTSVEVWIDYGTDGITFNSVQANPPVVSGDQSTPVQAELTDLAQGVRYYYRVRAIGPYGHGIGETRSLDVASLSGLIQQFPPGVAPAERQGALDIILTPDAIGAGWRFKGEQFWRESSVPATGLTGGDRVVEYRPVPGYLQPATEAVAISSSPVATSLARSYIVSGGTASGGVTVILKPQDLTEADAPARWRFFGESDADWKESATTVSDLVPGAYVIECKPVDGRSTPSPVTAVVQDGQTTAVTITYYIADELIGTPPGVIGFDEVSGDSTLPNAFVGQIRSDVGSGTGFVVRPRVVVTVGHVVFDDGTLSATTGLQWLFQRDKDVHDPVPLTPRGHYLLTGYAAQRALDNSPGVSSPESQNLDAATMFFVQNAGRGGFSGYLASDTSSNEFLLSDALKTLAGYPIDNIATPDLDRMHATPPANIQFQLASGRTYKTSDVRTSGGASGGPVSVLAENGAFYPAAIYLGGTGQTIVRAIDSQVVSLISFADASSADGIGVNGGTQSQLVSEDYANPDLGALKVLIEPASALNSGAGWRIDNGSPYVPSGGQLDDLAPGDYSISFPVLAGFIPPSPQPVTLEAGKLKTLTFTYAAILNPPLITSPGTASGTRGESFSYQITADNLPELYSLSGVLPAGLTFDSLTGLISGSLDEAGVFTVDIGASSSGGADIRKLVITSLPVIGNQTWSAPYLVPASYSATSSEAGPGVTWTSTGLPAGLVLNPASGVISGIPQTPGVYQIHLTVTKLGATSAADLTATITGIPPMITLQPVASRSIQYGATTTLTVAASGLPDPVFQWYEGPPGDTSAPVPGATSPNFTTPLLTNPVTYWARASSISGTADSNASLISILPSSNANLIGLFTSSGVVSPPFNLGVTSYSLTVPNDVSAIQITPLVEVGQSTVRVNGALVPQDSASDPVELIVGSNLLNILVTAGNETTTKSYTLTVTRAQPPSVITGAVTDAAYSTATLRGSATPNGAGTVFFQYGTTNSYGSATAGQEISSSSAIAIEHPVSGLAPEVTYHYRIGLTTGAGTIFGSDMTFTTTKAPPLVATGQAVDLSTGSVKLVGAVDTNGTPTTVHFEYSETGAASPVVMTTPPQLVPGGSGVIDIEFTLEGLLPDSVYQYRLLGNSTAGTTYGEYVTFVVGQANGGTGTPDALPDATTIAALDVSASTALLHGLVNPQGGTTFVRFDYGLTTAYGKSTPARGIGSGTDPATVIQQIDGLLAGTTYHFRIVAFNSLGTSYGGDMTFVTGFMDPQAITGGASPLSVNSARVSGAVRPRGAPVDVFFDYGTDGSTFPNRVQISGGPVSGDTEAPVSADLTNLIPGVTYYYRTIAIRPGNPSSFGTGEVKRFESDALIGLFQKFPRELDATEYQAEVQVNLLPLGTGKWRFVGEPEWRNSGAVATGLTTADREIEFLPVAGLLQPARELIGVISGTPRLVLDREYSQSATPGDSALKVDLEPSDRTTATPTSRRIQWRLAGSNTWQNSQESVTGLMPGSYLIEFRKSDGLDAPPPATLVVARGEIRTATFAYTPQLETNSNAIKTKPFSTISTARNLPYAYVGQIRTDAGSHSGFVVKQRVVATTAQAVFDEVTLSQVPGTQWLFQRDREVHEPKPMTPRGFYVFDGYAAQRESENTPGVLSDTAQSYNAAAIYFLADAGRGGYSGFVASDPESSPLLEPATLKNLTGFPVRGGLSTSNFGRMQSTNATTGACEPVSPTVFSTSTFLGLTGMQGGPLCAQRDGGSYYPIGIYLGGTQSRNLVRAIDSGIIDLFNRAEYTADTGENNVSGGISQTNYTVISTTSTKGSLTVLIQPAEAISAGALWKLGTDATYAISGARKNNLTPGDYVLQFKAIPGFQTPPDQTVAVVSNNLSTVTFTYLPELSAVASWREQNFGETSNSGTAADGEDPDGDGSLNIDEYIAGTNPLDPADVFKVISTSASGSTFSAIVSGKAGRSYVLQRQPDLTSDSWITVATVNSVPADGPLTLTDPNTAGTHAFYRVQVVRTSP